MRAAQSFFASLLKPARLIWLVALALALQPLAWARQPAAQWVSLPYCVSQAPGPGAAAMPVRPAPPRAAQTSSPHPAQGLLVLLNPAAALSAAGAQAALPAASRIAMAVVAPSGQPRLPDWVAPHRSGAPQTPQQPRAPPQHS
ncbi:MAG: transcriptional regulator algP [Burkholderiaceae bacterium]|nr:transcriptional regulator algP [Burkholderiaceae bacterium]